MSKHICGYCEIGSHKGQIELMPPPHLRRDDGRGICVDVCLAIEISNLWRMGISTTGCCCGHGKVEPYIGVADADIPKMIAMGYKICPNETDPTREDGFYPKSISTPATCDELERYTALELVRSIDAGREPEPDDEGDYCSYDEAIEIIAAKDARIAELEAKLETANALVTCCCGSLVNDHDMGSGHSPVDQYHYAMVQLESDNKRLREALEPFADVADLDIGDDEDDRAVFWPISDERFSLARRLRVGDLRRASEALGETEASPLGEKKG